MAVSWRDALKQAAAPRAVPATPASVDPGAVSPTLQRLLDERKRMEVTMAGLTGQGDGSDPRFAVTPLAQRRAELARWAAARDVARSSPPSRAPDTDRTARASGEPDPIPVDRSAGGRGPSERPDARATDPMRPERTIMDRMLPDRSVAGRMLAAFAPVRGDPPLRTTPGESAAGSPTRADAFGALRDALRAGEPDRAPAARTPKPREPAPREATRREPARGDASGFTERAFDRIRTNVAKPLKGEAAIARAKKSIPDDWRERARKMVPTLDDSSYAKRASKLLGVDVGSLEELAERAE
jgi:hypothetical protein